LIGLFVKQGSSPKARNLATKDPAITAWWGTKVECASALARLEREGILVASEAELAFSRIQEISEQWIEVPASSRLREIAIRMLRVHVLRAADAMQLAAAFTAAENNPSTLEFVCFDKRLASAAAKEGFRVLD